MREFLLSELTDKKWNAGANLKEYLGYAGQKLNVDLEVVWYEDHFPNSLQLRHCFQVYQLLYTCTTNSM